MTDQPSRAPDVARASGDELLAATDLADAREAASKNRILGGEGASTGNDLQVR